ncbi:hypothetical protein [Chondromyces apiculatus]|uniref:Peptidase C-terminal archaeal/bacterial domain-containing protein n=1 Tax=Chondromyces apiculatus DSM 436 TaxID=1192034 RepID=A0A017SXC3_9BACT|nr:hypothetical protein [Chondromyces apiculatus]EYF00961.1 Hypothetical protein CAP_8829 [Chondromyces apiculatus DSM 436]
MKRSLSWMNACAWMLPVALLGGCGGMVGDEVEPGFEDALAPVGEAASALLAPPPPPASGNIADSTTYLGPLAIGSAVQTSFTTSPQYYAFGLQVPSHAQLKLEVTHLGSSNGLDTSLFLYGPRDASGANGSYGVTPVALDDEDGYGSLSRIKVVSLEQGGDYLAVVSSASGAGKQFRLQADCAGWSCLPSPAPTAPSTAALDFLELDVASSIQAQLDAANGHDGVNSELRTFDFGWPYAGEPSLDQAVKEALKQGYDYRYKYDTGPLTLTYADFFGYMVSFYRGLHPEILAEYGNGTEAVQVRRYYRTYQTGPNGDHWDSLFIILFPQSHKVVVYEQSMYEI